MIKNSTLNSIKNLENALSRLEEILAYKDIEKLDHLQDAAIHRFEFTIELFWKVLKKILLEEKVDTTTPKDVLSKAYQYKLIDNEEAWLSMLDDRNVTSHIYHQETAREIFHRIKDNFPVLKSAFLRLKEKTKKM